MVSAHFETSEEIKQIKETVRNSFKSVQQINWAWVYFCDEQGAWVQFDCTECIILEFNYHAFNISGKDAFRVVETLVGDVDLKDFTFTPNDSL